MQRTRTDYRASKNMALENPISEAPPSLSHLVSSNKPPSAIETKVTRTFIEALNSQLHSLDAEIAELANLLEEKKQRRELVNDLVRRHQTILQPLRSLPPEIFSEIFLRCLPANNWIYLFPRVPNRPIPSEAPLLLTQICRSWRKFALETPRLWTALKVDIRAALVIKVDYLQDAFLSVFEQAKDAQLPFQYLAHLELDGFVEFTPQGFENFLI